MRPSTLALAALLAVGCDDYHVHSMNRTVTVGGRYCTNDSTTFGVPIKVLLIVDTSQSMMINDPMGHRGTAATALVQALQSRPNLDVSFAFEHFDTAAVSLTNGFTKDPAQISAAIGQLNLMQGFTNYLAALEAARTVITKDIQDTAMQLRVLEQMGVNTRLMRPWYFIVFLSDGIPRMPGAMLQDTSLILAEEELLMQVPPSDVAGITLDTAFLGADNDADRVAAETLLGKMAAVGNGTYIRFNNGEQIDFSLFDFEIKRLYDLKQLLVYNRTSALPDDAEVPLPDSDSDGLDDERELKLGTDPHDPDTDHDGRGDGYEVLAAQTDPLHGAATCTAGIDIDTDHDGLNDCEEESLSLEKDKFDSDVDMFPDRFELLWGSNPIDATDVNADIDADGMKTGDELKSRTKVWVRDADQLANYGFQFATTRSVDQTKGAFCFDYRVSNVDVVRTEAVGNRAAGVNEIVIDAIEVPKDRPENEFTLRRLVMPVRFDDYMTTDIVTTDEKFDTITTMEIKRLPNP